MSAVADARGLKRICDECGTRFYDMNNRPIICPNCQTEFTGEIKVKGRRGRVAEETAETPKAAANDEAVKNQVEEAGEDIEEDETPEVEEVSLDDVAAAEDGEASEHEEAQDSDAE